MPQATVYDAQGNPLPDEVAADALASGQGAVKRGQNVVVRSPSGEYLSGPAQNVGVMLEQGYSVAAPQEVRDYEHRKALQQDAETTAGIAKTVGEGALRGATFGASDVVLSKALDNREEMEARREFNPGAATTGEIVGAVAPGLISGGAGAGAGLLARGGALARTTARLAPSGMVARGATGAGRAVARRLGGGKLAKAAGLAAEGTLEGAAFGAGQAVSDLALQEAAVTDPQLAAEKILAGAGSGALTGAIFGGGLGALGAGAGAVGSKLSGKIKASGGAKGALEKVSGISAFRQATGGGARATRQAGDLTRQARIGNKLQDMGIDIMRPAKGLDQVKAKLGEVGESIGAVAKRMDDAGKKIDGAALRSKIDERIAALESSTTSTARKTAKRLKKEFVSLDGGDLSFSDAWKAKREVGELIGAGKNPADLKPIEKEMRKIYGALNDAMDGTVKGVDDDASRAWRKANEDFSDLKVAEGALDFNATQRAQKAFIPSIVEGVTAGAGSAPALAAGIATGSAGVGVLTGAASGLVMGAGARFIRQSAPGYLAKAARALAKTDERMASTAIRLTGKNAPGKLGQATRAAAVSGAVSLEERFDRAQRNIQMLQTPSYAMERLRYATRGLEGQPGLVGAMHQTLMDDAAYAQSILPASQANAAHVTLTPRATKGLVSQSQKQDFLTAMDALADPAAVLEDLAEGNYNPVAFDALKARRPRFFESMRHRVMAVAAESEEEIPYKNRVLLGLAFDFTADSSMSPETATLTQAAFDEPDADQPGPSTSRVTIDPAESMRLPYEVT